MQYNEFSHNWLSWLTALITYKKTGENNGFKYVSYIIRLLQVAVWVTTSLEQSPSAKVTSPSPSQEIPYISWNPKVYHVHKSVLLVPVLSHMNLGHTPQHTALWLILILCSYLHPGLPNGLLSFFRCPPPKPCIHFSSHNCVCICSW